MGLNCSLDQNNGQWEDEPQKKKRVSAKKTNTALLDNFPYGGRMLNYIIQAAHAERELADAVRLYGLSLGPMQQKCLRGPLHVDASLGAEWTTSFPVAEVEDFCACCCDACEAGEHCYTKNVCFDQRHERPAEYATEESPAADALTVGGFVHGDECSTRFDAENCDCGAVDALYKSSVAPWNRRSSI